MNRPSSGPDLFADKASAGKAGLEYPAVVKPDNIILSGPPGSGKSTLGKALAQRLGRPFFGMDEIISERAGSIEDIFAGQGEAAFRRLEARVCREAAAGTGHVIAAGGGALLDPDSRAALEASGTVVMLECTTDVLIRRLQKDSRRLEQDSRELREEDRQPEQNSRPLLGLDPAQTLPALLEKRREHYSSFRVRIDVSEKTADESIDSILAVLEGQKRSTIEISTDPPSRLLIGEDLFAGLQSSLRDLDLKPPFAVISDTNTGPLYGEQIAEHLGGSHFQFPAGEQHKSFDTLLRIYDHLYAQRMERQGTLIAVGGGVTGDLAGMAAATYLRGVHWVNVATSLLAMVDSSLGGKVAVDLPQGKNLVGAFHNPALILSDTRMLNTLPRSEFQCGMAELIKAAVIADPLLFEWLENGAEPSSRWIQRAVQVKARIVMEDPLEKGIRASLNLGHTIGHSIETASRFAFSHGEAVAVGMLVESMLAEKLGLAEPGLTERIRRVTSHYGLPGVFKGANPQQLLDGLKSDKKNVNRRLAFALPLRPGEVKIGCQVPRDLILETLAEMQEQS